MARRMLCVGIDNVNGVEQDLSSALLQQAFLDGISSGLFWYVHLAVPCSIWSVARKGITNFARAAGKELASLDLAIFSVSVVRACLRAGIYFSLENPLSSKL